MASPDQINIRLQLGITSDPALPPLDLNTGKQPQAWRGASLGVDIGIFDELGAAVDLSNLDFLEVDIFPATIFNQLTDSNFRYNPYSVPPYPNLPPAPLLFQTVEADDITALISRDEWVAGNVQQARALFSWVQLAALELDGKPSRDFWLVVHGMTATGRKIVYGGTKFTVFDPGAQDIYLPNHVAPLIVPADTILYIQPNQQLVYAETIDVEGTIVVDGGILIQSV